jgi:hypothetical protein
MNTLRTVDPAFERRRDISRFKGAVVPPGVDPIGDVDGI